MKALKISKRVLRDISKQILVQENCLQSLQSPKHGRVDTLDEIGEQIQLPQILQAAERFVRNELKLIRVQGEFFQLIESLERVLVNSQDEILVQIELFETSVLEESVGSQLR